MLLTLTTALLISPPIQRTGTMSGSTRTTTRTVTWRDPVERISVRAGERVRIVLTNPDARGWTAVRPITKTIALVSSNSAGKTSTFDYTTSAAARPNLEFRHPSGGTRTVKLTIVAADTRDSVAKPGTTVVNSRPVPLPVPVNPRYSFNASHADKMVTVPLGELFEIRLDENLSTPYAWRPEPWPTDIVALKSSTYVPIKPVLPGSGGTRVYRLKAIARGTGDIELVNEPAGGPRDDVTRFHLVVDVK